MIREVKLVECPRDAMQGLAMFVPTELKIKYLQKLLEVQFDTLDFGSFVSAKAIPQMSDTAAVIDQLDLSKTTTKLLAIVANLRGAISACQYPAINYIGFPFSISPTFQMRNTNSSIEESRNLLKDIIEQCVESGKELVVYLSMAFGNPYGDPWNADIAIEWTDHLQNLGVRRIALSDTIGVAHAENINYLFSNLIPRYSNIEFGAHFHTRPEAWEEKIAAAYDAGCLRFDGAIKGYGGCPMAKDELTGNMPTEKMVQYFNQNNIPSHIDQVKFFEAIELSDSIFNVYH
ncbi:MAG: hydroxymethylglutaryl-CoA lyase [Saprospiraceae bacterium]|nr:hydroxymethylglutaryl-CoA lyase [Saprospiraceae bacterium]